MPQKKVNIYVCFSCEIMAVSPQCLTQHLCNALVAGDVYFDIQSIGDRYGKFVGAVDSQGEPGKCVCLLQSVSHFVMLEDRSVSLKTIIWMLKRHLIEISYFLNLMCSVLSGKP